FRPFVEAYGGSFARVEDWTEFSAVVNDALGRRGLRVIEVPTDRERNVVLHRAVWQRVESAVQDALAAAVV
ncbi:MAG: 2-succinyl-5-enolpyruvyl-6-hydroxy-3-cyclohexene-1-carboxylic-acid synthase, partial [Chloroflexi bacterium]|nr:2-succinyl-5-enolpyruvyl-6-hydroxy-3-cyclohexene-1-carboxylic-acid synthase [Chloroflexota bacterium]